MIPCNPCKEHARSFIENGMENIKSAAMSREKVFEFFIDFHNHVNKFNGKTELSYAKAFSLYSEGF